MSSLKNTINPFNRTVSNIGIEQLLTNEPLNTGLFIGIQKATDLKKWSGVATKTELEAVLDTGQLVNKIDVALNQRKADGAGIYPSEFFTAGMVIAATPGSMTDEEKTDFKNFLELTIKKVTIDNDKRFCAIGFEDVDEFIDDEDYMVELEAMIRSYGCVAFIPSDVNTTITEKIKKDTSNLFYFKTHEISSGVFEKGVDFGAIGRVVFLGVGKTDGVAKELSRITADKASIVSGDGGDLTATESKEWKDKGYNMFNQFTSNYNETTGIVNPSGEDFTNIWTLLKVASDVSADLNQLRHFSERLSTSIQDQGVVRGTIVNRMSKLKKGDIDPDTKKETKGIIYDYRVTSQNLDYTLETNKGKFGYNIEVSLFQEGKWFLIDITGYKDGRKFEAEVV